MRMVELISEISFELVKNADGAWTEEHERQVRILASTFLGA